MGEDRLAEQLPARSPGPIKVLSVKRGINLGWHIRYVQDCERKSKRNFPTEAAAWAWLSNKVQQYGGTR